jgi:Ca-activated chloride channel family protein
VSFRQPLLLIALLVIPLAVGIYLLAERRRMRYAVTFTNVDVLAGVIGGRQWKRYVAPLLFLVALAAAAGALARPEVSTLEPRDRATVILVIDTSGSMLAEDVKPSRLGAAQEAVRRFLDRVPKRVQVGLIVFAAEPQVATPPTTDRDLVREAVDTLGLFEAGGRGTAIGDALAAAAELGQQAVGAGDRPQGQTIANVTVAYRTVADAEEKGTLGPVSILFLSDGAQTRGILSPLDGAERARAAGIPVFTVALGTADGRLDRGGFGGFGIPVPPDPVTLKAVSARTGGQFFEARSADALTSAYERLGSKLGRVPGEREISSILLVVAGVFLVGAAGASALWSARLP